MAGDERARRRAAGAGRQPGAGCGGAGRGANALRAARRGPSASRLRRQPGRAPVRRGRPRGRRPPLRTAPRRIAVVQQARPRTKRRCAPPTPRLGIPAEIAPFFDDMPARLAHAHWSSPAPAPPPWRNSPHRPPRHPGPLRRRDGRSSDRQRPRPGRGRRRRGHGRGRGDPRGAGRPTRGDSCRPARLTRMAAAAKERGKPEAAATLADLVERLAQTQRRHRP
jgi:hypothetical protein